ncbi:MAG: DUF92 domain-containing protein [Candidatus Thalassarchaeum sp.]|nr:DUF92 domain-containing protein [Candidatus Thalassarchaeum sp.]
MVDPSTYFSDDQMISIALVVGLLLVSKLRDMLNLSGMLAAMAVGLTVSLLGHWTWLIILVIFLFVASIATKWRFEEKRALSIQESNEGARGWRNVMANGAAASIVAILGWFGNGDWYFLAVTCSVSVALSDTLASEIGSLDPRTRSIITLEAVPPGTNGGMSPTGTIAALLGALIIAVSTALLAPVYGEEMSATTIFVTVTIVGWLGCQIDSILGELLENRGYIGKHTVNFLATLSGAVMAAVVVFRFL